MNSSEDDQQDYENFHPSQPSSQHQMKPQCPAKAEPGPEGNSSVQCCRGWNGKTKAIWPLYAVHIVLFVLWAILLAILIVKSSQTAKGLEMLHFNQSTLRSTEAELATELKRLQSDQATLKKEVLEALAKGKSDRDDIRAQAHRILDAVQKGKESACRICPANWLPNTGCCYYFAIESKPWSHAKQACVDQGAQLVVIDNQQEQEFLQKHMNGKEYWIGLNDLSKEGTFTWVDDSSVSYSNWNQGEPNNVGSGEDCVMMYKDGKWNDAQCANNVDGWICEKKWTC
ncbi:uncharacterized protein LOC142003438 [Carettochelys insculpta]|uniref:uncharacterized protein LOC142003438 n=1 Tax=Carettochelys insculpta TaxID=44489 RepID=UPI003EC0357F